jgi:uncharacterized caspase-like protein
MRALVGIVLTAWLTLLAGQPALADKRVALVIGNSSYQKVARLSNPANDATAVAAMFKAAGFDAVESKLDLTVSELRKALRDFGNKSREADVAVVYYAGHGIELDGTNYLIPVDATLETDADVLDETVPLDRVLFAVEPAKQLRLVILDACRDNPFTKRMKRTIASRAVGRGLAKVEPTSPNTMIAFAAKAGSTASDGDSAHSPFAAALVTHLPKPGLDLRRAFGFVRDEVLKNTGNKQEPYVYGSLGGDDVPLVPAKPVATSPQSDPQFAVRRDYELALQLATRDGWEAFLSQYPDGFYANLAKGQLKKIAAEEAHVTAAEKARLAEQEKTRLTAEGAKPAEQARAATAVKAAEEARIFAEKAAAAERVRIAEQEKVRLATEKAATDQERATPEKTAAEKKEQLASWSSSVERSEQDVPADLPRVLQVELHRVGCNTGVADGNWNTASQHAIGLFNKNAGTNFEVKVATIDALDAVRSKTTRICPLICERGYKADGDRCTKITCRTGYAVGDEDTCEKIKVKKPTSEREDPQARPEKRERAKEESKPAKPQASGQIFCGQGGCRPVARGCRLEQRSHFQGGPPNGSGGLAEVCN